MPFLQQHWPPVLNFQTFLHSYIFPSFPGFSHKTHCQPVSWWWGWEGAGVRGNYLRCKCLHYQYLSAFRRLPITTSVNRTALRKCWNSSSVIPRDKFDTCDLLYAASRGVREKRGRCEHEGCGGDAGAASTSCAEDTRELRARGCGGHAGAATTRVRETRGKGEHELCGRYARAASTRVRGTCGRGDHEGAGDIRTRRPRGSQGARESGEPKGF